MTDEVALDFVGYQFFKSYTLLRKKTKIRLKRKFRQQKKKIEAGNESAKEKLRQTLSSYKGWLMHCNGRHLWYKITGMKKFSELNIRHESKGKDGQIFFDVPQVSLAFIVGRPIIVKDFQANITTKNGGGRYAVLISEGGKDCKFITNNPRLKDVLDQCRTQNAFPFEATLNRRALNGNKIDYYFE